MAAWRTAGAAQTGQVLRLVGEVFGPDVLGAYEHGSAVLGGVQSSSDVDILVVTGRLATPGEKRRLVDGLMAISARFPPPGPERCVEVTVVAQPQVRPWRYPPSFDLQYGEWLRERFERGDGELLQPTVDPDLTTLLTIVLLGDRPLFGPPAGELLDPVPQRTASRPWSTISTGSWTSSRGIRATSCSRWRASGRPSPRASSTGRTGPPNGRGSGCRQPIGR